MHLMPPVRIPLGRNVRFVVVGLPGFALTGVLQRLLAFIERSEVGRLGERRGGHGLEDVDVHIDRRDADALFLIMGRVTYVHHYVRRWCPCPCPLTPSSPAAADVVLLGPDVRAPARSLCVLLAAAGAQNEGYRLWRARVSHHRHARGWCSGSRGPSLSRRACCGRRCVFGA